MDYRASLAEIEKTYLGKVYGNGQCAIFVEGVAHAPHTTMWKAGTMVKGQTALVPGTAIATFDSDGKYGNHVDGRSHAAIYISQSVHGIDVFEQWVGQPVQRRTIHFHKGSGKAVNDGDRYSVIGCR